MRCSVNLTGVRVLGCATMRCCYSYNSGARADEAAKLTVGSLQLGASPSVRRHGKGNKVRNCPLWSTTATSLARLVTDRDKNDAVFLGRTKQPLTRFVIHRVVTQYAVMASKALPTLARKRVSPHAIRHTTAVHLLRAGVDINTIRAWLGHVSLDTTHIYAEVDLEMKAKVDIGGLREPPRQRSLPSLMAFLKALQTTTIAFLCGGSSQGNRRDPWLASCIRNINLAAT
jgi:integrase/recombinase XerD